MRLATAHQVIVVWIAYIIGSVPPRPLKYLYSHQIQSPLVPHQAFFQLCYLLSTRFTSSKMAISASPYSSTSPHRAIEIRDTEVAKSSRTVHQWTARKTCSPSVKRTTAACDNYNPPRKWDHDQYILNQHRNTNYIPVVPGTGRQQGRSGLAASKWAY